MTETKDLKELIALAVGDSLREATRITISPSDAVIVADAVIDVLGLGWFGCRPDVLGGIACFTGTRIPIVVVFEHHGHIEDWRAGLLDDYPTLTNEMIDKASAFFFGENK